MRVEARSVTLIDALRHEVELPAMASDLELLAWGDNLRYEAPRPKRRQLNAAPRRIEPLKAERPLRV